jgi:hypothetical protein
MFCGRHGRLICQPTQLGYSAKKRGGRYFNVTQEAYIDVVGAANCSWGRLEVCVVYESAPKKGSSLQLSDTLMKKAAEYGSPGPLV